MKTFLKIIFLLFLAVALNGCNCTEGEGSIKTETRNLKDFNSIALDISADVTVIKGQSFKAEIETYVNLLEEIKTKIRNGDRLEISSSGCISSDKKIKIKITLPELDGLQINGSGSIVVPDTFVVDKINMEINGSGNIKAYLVAARAESEIHGSGNIVLTGSANINNVEIMGSGNIRAENFPCNESDIEINGSGDVYSYVIKNLDVELNGSGAVHYKGKPQVNTQVNGSGRVVDDNPPH
jgi:hypothetical protein